MPPDLHLDATFAIQYDKLTRNSLSPLEGFPARRDIGRGGRFSCRARDIVAKFRALQEARHGTRVLPLNGR